ncbi:MAG: methyl-accepting chemotaxis protein [Desulfomonilia bacterium]|jgi:methyl-accepting chemotaxis protein
MMVNLKLETKLIIIGFILLSVPIIIVGLLSVDRSSRTLEESEKEQLIGDTKLLAQAVEKTLIGEMRIVKDLSISPETVRAASSIANSGYQSAQGDIDALNVRLGRFGQTEGLKDNSQLIYVTDREGKAFAASVDKHIGFFLFSKSRYIKDALAGNANIGRPDVNRDTGELFIPVAAPVYSPDGKVVGAIVNVLSMGVINDMISRTKIGKTGYAWMIDKEGRIIVHPDREYLLKINVTTLEGMKAIAKKMVSGQSGVENYVLKNVSNTCGFAPVSMTGWSIGCSLPDGEFRARAGEVRDFVVMVGVISFVAIFIVFYSFSRVISTRIKKVADLAAHVGEGDLTADNDIHQKDEIGQIADALRNSAARMKDVMADVQEIADNVTVSSMDMISFAEKMSESASNQASMAKDASSFMEHMKSTIRRNTDNTQQTEEIAAKIAKHAQLAENAVEATISSMKTITGKVAILEDVARQTNLLALVAAMEAAKSGEQGKGSAVAIAEIRRLIEKSADTADEISLLSTNSIDVAVQAGEIFSQIIPDIHMTALLIHEINSVSTEQNTRAEKIDSAISQINQMIQQNESKSRILSSAAEGLSNQAALLQKAVSFFKIDREGIRTVTSIFKIRKTDDVLPKPDKENLIEDAHMVIKNKDEGIPRLTDVFTSMSNQQTKRNTKGEEQH